MDKNKKGSFKVGDWRVEPDLDCVVRGAESANLRPQVMELLVYLAHRPGEVVAVDQLLKDIWPDKVVTSGSIYNCIAELRQVLAGGGDGSHYVQTIPKKGYRLVAPVSGLVPSETGTEVYVDARKHGHSVAARYIGIAIVALVSGLLAIRLYSIDQPATASVTQQSKVSIVVLPFSDLSPDRDQAYFCDGITEELVTGLARIAELRVVSHTSSKSLRDSVLSTQQLAEKLGVAYVLEGSVRKAGDHVRITAQLIDARADTQLWSQTYDRNLADIFAIQDEISAHVLDELKVRLFGPVSSARSTDPRAFELVLRGRYLVGQRKSDALRQAVPLFEQAAEIDPRYAPAQAGLAKALYLLSAVGYTDSVEVRVRADEAVDRALVLDPENTDALAVRGLMLTRSNLDAAREYFERAIASNPTNSDARRWLALSYSEVDPPRYLQEMRAAYLVDPLLSPLNFHRVVALSRLGYQTEALDAARAWHDLYPGYAGPYATTGNIYARSGEPVKAVKSYYVAYRREPDEGVAGDLPWLLMDVGELELAETWVREAPTADPADAVVQRVAVAELRGQRDDAVGFLADVEERHPDWWRAIGRAHVLLGNFGRAREAWEHGLASPDMNILGNVLNNWGVSGAIHFALALQRTGAHQQASALIEDALALTDRQIGAGMVYYGEWSGVRASPRFHAAALHAMRGETQQSLEALQRDASGGSVSCPVCLKLWPQFDSLRADPTFTSFVAEQERINAVRRQQLSEEGLLLTPRQVLSLQETTYDPFPDNREFSLLGASATESRGEQLE